MLIGADYSQIELRVLAHLSGDDLIKAFNSYGEIYTEPQLQVLGVPLEGHTSGRSRAKAVNFGEYTE
ncbi:MAG: DNA polymerase [Anaerovoracaceae bacterium]